MAGSRRAQTKMIIYISVVIVLVIVTYALFTGWLSRLAPILGKLGVIETGKAEEKEEQARLSEAREIPAEEKAKLEEAITSISDVINACKRFTGGTPCLCDLSLPDFGPEYIIRIRDTSEGGFIAAYKTDKNDVSDIPLSEQVGATNLPVDPCFSSSLEMLSDDLTRVQSDPQQAMRSLSAVYEPFFNIARDENKRLWTIVPKQFTDKGGATCVGRSDMEYRLLGAAFSNINTIKLIRFADNNICFIVDRQEDRDTCYADVREATAEAYSQILRFFPSCG